MSCGCDLSVKKGGKKPKKMAGGGAARIARRARRLQEGAPPRQINPEITVYHGTPHVFAPEEGAPLGRFRASQIGTGEGAQAYGHGIYVAESPDVAKSYAEILSNRDMSNQGRLNAHANAKRLASLTGDSKYAADDLRFALEAYPDHPQKKLMTETLQILESGEHKNPLKNQGSLYTVDLPDPKVEQMLDWDKPLSEQSRQVQDAISEVANDLDLIPYKNSGMRKSKTGEDFYNSVASALGSNKAASNYLASWNVPGLRYLDAGSRTSSSDALWGLSRTQDKVKKLENQYAANPSDALASRLEDARQELQSARRRVGELSRNFVIFPGEEQSLEILEKKYKGGPIKMAGGGAARIARRAKRLREGQPPRQVSPEIVRETGGQMLTAGSYSPISTGVEIAKKTLHGGQRGYYGPELGGFSKESAAAVDPWLETTLRKYFARDMGSPSDPLRKLANDNVVLQDYIEETRRANRYPDAAAKIADQKRAAAYDIDEEYNHLRDSQKASHSVGFSEGWSPQAEAFEDIIDSSLTPRTAGEIIESSTKMTLDGITDSQILKDNPWIEKLDPKTPIIQLDRATSILSSAPGLSTIGNKLAQSIDDTELPSELRLRPEQLNNLSMTGAALHLAKIAKFREARERARLLENNPTLKPYKKYGEDYGWFEFQGGDEEALKKALKDESDIMGHCVGSNSQYCQGIMRGTTKILTLRDLKTGEPHVTVEIDPSVYPHSGDTRPGISQIKGKGNEAPVAKYLPYVQDLVRSNDWQHVFDLENTGLSRRPGISAGTLSHLLLKQSPEFREIYEKTPSFMSKEEANALDSAYGKASLVYKPNDVSEENWLKTLRETSPYVNLRYYEGPANDNMQVLRDRFLVEPLQAAEDMDLGDFVEDPLPRRDLRRDPPMLDDGENDIPFAKGGAVKMAGGGAARIARRERRLREGLPPRQINPEIVREPGGQMTSDIAGGLLRDARTSALLGIDDEIDEAGVDALRNWLDTAMRKYFARDMGSRNDVLRKLANEGVLPSPEESVSLDAYMTALANRDMAKEVGTLKKDEATGDVESYISTTGPGMHFEEVVDAYLYPDVASFVFDRQPESVLRRDPWLAKVPPDTPVIRRGFSSGLTSEDVLRHTGIQDMLRSFGKAVITPESVPEQFRVRPENLQRMSVEQVARHVKGLQDFNAQQAAVDLLKSKVFKPYGEKMGDYQWFEFSPEAGEADLKKALKQESDIMQHCVGQEGSPYCKNILEGTGKILTLRDTKTGQPHATAEVLNPLPWTKEKPETLTRQYGDTYKKLENLWYKFVRDSWKKTDGTIGSEFTDNARRFEGWLANNDPEALKELQPILNRHLTSAGDIRQIKGKQNAALVQKYQPYAQQLLRSKDWGRVNDLYNAGMIDFDPASDLANAMRAVGEEPPRFVTNEELTNLMKKFNLNNYARGGKVKSSPLSVKAYRKGCAAK